MINDFYAERDRNNQYERQWGYVNPVAAAYWRMRDEIIFEQVLKKFDPLGKSLQVLEIGTGHGHELAKYSQLGIPPSNLFGVDLVIDRMIQAKHFYPSITYFQQDGCNLAFADQTFDIVFQLTCFVHATSIDMQQTMCLEMARVLKPGGLIIWWDIGPLSWRVLLFRQFLGIFSGDNLFRKILECCKNVFAGILNPAYRRELLQKSVPIYLLPISRQSVENLFPKMDVQAKYTGVDYNIWDFLWRRSQTLAQWLWRAGWLWQHCFAVIEKPKI